MQTTIGPEKPAVAQFTKIPGQATLIQDTKFEFRFCQGATMARGDWLALIRPHLVSYFNLPRGQREPFAMDLAARLGLKVNTVQRQLLAAQYLRAKGLDNLQAPLLSVEAVARVGRYNRRHELDLLKSLADGTGDTDFYRQQAEEAAHRRFAALSMTDRQTAKTFELSEIIEYLRTIQAEHLAPLRSSLVIADHHFNDPAGLTYGLRTIGGLSVHVYNLPYRLFSELNTQQANFLETQILRSICFCEYVIVICAFEFEIIEDVTRHLNERNRPFFFRFNGRLPDEKLLPLGYRFPELERQR
jgi:hypothetical protein